MAGTDVAAQHRLRPLVQAPEQGAEGGADDEGDHERAQRRPSHRSAEGALGRCAEAQCLTVLLQVALHHRHRVQHLGGDRARVGDPVLAGAREPAHAPADVDGRQDDQHQDRQHLRHHHRVGDDQHEHRADAHHRIAQAHREARADDGLHQGRVGREARQHLAGLRGLEELRALPHDVRIDGAAQVGGDPLAEPAHHVEAGGGEQAEGDADAEQGDEVLAHRHHPGTRVAADEALVDQAAQRHRKDQGARRREHEEQHREHDPAAVGAQEGQQARERADVSRRGRRGRRGRAGHRQSLGEPRFEDALKDPPADGAVGRTDERDSSAPDRDSGLDSKLAASGSLAGQAKSNFAPKPTPSPARRANPERPFVTSRGVAHVFLR